MAVKLGDRELCLEVKSRADFKTLYGWLEQRDALILKADRKDPLVVPRLSDALTLLGDKNLEKPKISTEMGG